MYTKYLQDGDVNKYFSSYDSPEVPYFLFMYALLRLRGEIQYLKNL